MENEATRIPSRMRVAIFILLLLAACQSPIRYPVGGYDYPLQVSARDTNYYYYPVRNKFSRRDSLRAAWEYKTYRTLDEPNLSLKPAGADIFRLVYSEALAPDPIIITLTPGAITVKIAKLADYDSQASDTALLTPLERNLKNILDHNYPIDDTAIHSTRKQHRLDSLGALYPQLYNPAYYDSLVRKGSANAKPAFTYTTKKISITQSDYRRLVTAINTSGYWQLPHRLPREEVTDGYGYILEANTVKKYNFVSSGSGEDRSHPFPKACQQLVRAAGMDKRIHLCSDPGTDTAKKAIIIEKPH